MRYVMEAQEALSLRVELLSSKVDSLRGAPTTAGTPRQAGPGPGDNGDSVQRCVCATVYEKKTVPVTKKGAPCNSI